jgi:hypothetical protein
MDFRRLPRRRVLRHQLPSDLSREIAIETSSDVYHGKLVFLCSRLRCEFVSLAIQIGPLGIGLRADRHVFTGRHGQSARHQACDSGNEHLLPTRSRRYDANHQAGCRDDAVIGPEYGGAKPPDAAAAVLLAFSHWPPDRRIADRMKARVTS